MVSGWSPPRSSGRRAGDGIAQSTLRAWLAVSPLGALGLVALGLAVSWGLTHAVGGAGHVVPHWYYVPILFAAVRFGPVAAIVVGLLSGVLAGPATYLDVATATPQETHRWLTRLAFFVVIGGGMASLVRSSLPSIVEEVQRRREEAALRRALQARELFLRYQPIIEPATGGLHGVEALIRWRHPERGEVSPGEFLPAAERSEVIHDLGAFVLEEACAQAVRWAELAAEAGVAAPRVSVNMSGRELESPALLERVRDCLQASGVDPGRICLEVTETTLIADIELFVARLAALKTLGVQLAVDDFGTGYSSLSAVHRFPIDVLKIDRSFLAALASDEGTESMLGGLVLFARSVDLTTVAEGVETAEQARLVAELGYDLAQGYHYARPSTAGVIDRLLLESKPLDVDLRDHGQEPTCPVADDPTTRSKDRRP